MASTPRGGTCTTTRRTRADEATPERDVRVLRRPTHARADAGTRPEPLTRSRTRTTPPTRVFAFGTLAGRVFRVGVVGGVNEHNNGTLWRSAWQLGCAFTFTVGARSRRPRGHHQGVDVSPPSRLRGLQRVCRGVAAGRGVDRRRDGRHASRRLRAPRPRRLHTGQRGQRPAFVRATRVRAPRLAAGRERGPHQQLQRRRDRRAGVARPSAAAARPLRRTRRGAGGAPRAAAERAWTAPNHRRSWR